MKSFSFDVVTVTVSKMVEFTGGSTDTPEGRRVEETTVMVGEMIGALAVPVAILEGGRSVETAVVVEGRNIVRLPVPTGLLGEKLKEVFTPLNPGVVDKVGTEPVNTDIMLVLGSSGIKTNVVVTVTVPMEVVLMAVEGKLSISVSVRI